jgi:hypothetical protein
MGTYISIPYVTRRSMSVEPSKPVTVQTTKVDSIPEVVKEEPKVEPVKEDIKDDVKEEPKEEVKEEVKEEPKIVDAPKEEPKNDVIEAEVVIPELLPKRLSVTIPSENSVVPDPSEKAIEVQRIPEFRGNMNSESHAIKKFNRRHRKHQQN